MPYYPLKFQPLYKDRVWGGRRLATRYGRALPDDRPYGESWEICDRPEDVSVIANGPLAGRTLRELMLDDAAGLLGKASSLHGRFPLLVKILDAQDVLSLQVHPPAECAAALGGEPKTEMWYVTEADAGADIYAGLKRGVTREQFAALVRDPSLAALVHRIPVRAGDAMFLPSGRVHALGAGLVIFEIQQNSDTTYRVHDWNRVGLDGRPRELHVEQSLRCIDFSDFEPSLEPVAWAGEGKVRARPLVSCPPFQTSVMQLTEAGGLEWGFDRAQIFGVVSGRLRLEGGGERLALAPGDFALVPAALGTVAVEAEGPAEWLVAAPGPAV